MSVKYPFDVQASHDHDDVYSQLAHDHDDVYSQLAHDHDDVYSQLAHDHDDVYSQLAHDHDDVYSQLDHDHDGVYALDAHDHDDVYSQLAHDHDGVYALDAHDHDGVYSVVAHHHDADYSPVGHDHDGVYSVVAHHHDAAYSHIAHHHDDLYALDGHNHDADYSDIAHHHDDDYEPKNANIQAHISNADIHVTAENKITWDGKADPLAFTPEDEDNKVTGWTVPTNDVHYPSEKLVKDSLDALAVVAGIGENHIMNPSFDHWQRGPGPFEEDVYGPDRWHLTFGGTTLTRITTPDTYPDSTYVVQVERGSGVHLCVISQFFESHFARALYTREVTLSFDMRNMDDDPVDVYAAICSFNGLDSNIAVTNRWLWDTQAHEAAKETWVRYEVTVTLDQHVDLRNGFRLRIGCTNDEADKKIQLGRIKLEIGGAATPYMKPDYVTDLLRCMRYYVRMDGHELALTTDTGSRLANGVRWPVRMRTTPTLTHYDRSGAGTEGEFGNASRDGTYQTVVANAPHRVKLIVNAEL